MSHLVPAISIIIYESSSQSEAVMKGEDAGKRWDGGGTYTLEFHLGRINHKLRFGESGA